MSPPIKVVLPSGEGQETLARGSLDISGPREQLVARSVPGAYTSAGVPSPDTLRTPIEKLFKQSVAPDHLAVDDVVEVHREEVVWGGNVLGRYGHFLAEAVAGLWPLLPGADLEGLPVVFTTLRDPPFAREWLEGFGAQTVALPERGTVRFERMLVPDSAWRVGGWVAPEIRDIHLHARQGMEVPLLPRQDVLWLSRSRLKRDRIAYDEGLLEWLLGDLVLPVHLETMPLAEQIGMLESCQTAAGIAGHAFDTLLLTARSPDCLYLCPPREEARYATQHRVIDAEAAFEVAVANTKRMHRARLRTRLYPGDHRVLIPEALRAFESSVLPDLLDDPRLFAFGRVGAEPSAMAEGSLGDELDDAALRVVREPFHFAARMTLGEIFEARGLSQRADEQYATVADLTDDPKEEERAKARQAALETRCES